MLKKIIKYRTEKFSPKQNTDNSSVGGKTLRLTKLLALIQEKTLVHIEAILPKYVSIPLNPNQLLGASQEYINMNLSLNNMYSNYATDIRDSLITIDKLHESDTAPNVFKLNLSPSTPQAFVIFDVDTQLNCAEPINSNRYLRVIRYNDPDDLTNITNLGQISINTGTTRAALCIKAANSSEITERFDRSMFAVQVAGEPNDRIFFSQIHITLMQRYNQNWFTGI